MTVQDWIDLADRAERYAGPKFTNELIKEIVKDAKEDAEAKLQHADALAAWALTRGVTDFDD